MKKVLFTFISLLLFSVITFGQCRRCFQHDESQDTIVIKTTDFEKRFPKAKEVIWKKCESTELFFAHFIEKDTTYSVMYNHKFEWLATEKRVFKAVQAFDWENEKQLQTSISIPSVHVFPSKLIPLMTENEYKFKASDYLNIKKEQDSGGMCDFFTITLSKNHPLVKQHNTNTFYVSNLDGIMFIFTNKKLVEKSFYDFYEK